MIDTAVLYTDRCLLGATVVVGTYSCHGQKKENRPKANQDRALVAHPFRCAKTGGTQAFFMVCDGHGRRGECLPFAARSSCARCGYVAVVTPPDSGGATRPLLLSPLDRGVCCPPIHRRVLLRVRRALGRRAARGRARCVISTTPYLERNLPTFARLSLMSFIAHSSQSF